MGGSLGNSVLFNPMFQNQTWPVAFLYQTAQKCSLSPSHVSLSRLSIDTRRADLRSSVSAIESAKASGIQSHSTPSFLTQIAAVADPGRAQLAAQRRLVRANADQFSVVFSEARVQLAGRQVDVPVPPDGRRVVHPCRSAERLLLLLLEAIEGGQAKRLPKRGLEIGFADSSVPRLALAVFDGDGAVNAALAHQIGFEHSSRCFPSCDVSVAALRLRRNFQSDGGGISSDMACSSKCAGFRQDDADRQSEGFGGLGDRMRQKGPARRGRP